MFWDQCPLESAFVELGIIAKETVSRLASKLAVPRPAQALVRIISAFNRWWHSATGTRLEIFAIAN